jgi:hypothetical protein
MPNVLTAPQAAGTARAKASSLCCSGTAMLRLTPAEAPAAPGAPAASPASAA